MAKKGKEQESAGPRTPRMVNRKARHEFHIVEVVEAGVELVGTEVKSLRAGQAKIDDGFVRVHRNEAFLVGVDIATYPNAAGLLQHEPKRQRKLLLHHRQIEQLAGHTMEKGRTIVPLAMYFKRGWVKLELGLVIGKKLYDKRQDLKKREAQRDMDRAMNRRRRD